MRPLSCCFRWCDVLIACGLRLRCGCLNWLDGLDGGRGTVRGLRFLWVVVGGEGGEGREDG